MWRRVSKMKTMRTSALLFAVVFLITAVMAGSTCAYGTGYIDGGTCGVNCTWTLDSDGLLVISGTGAMSAAGFNGKSDKIKHVIIGSGVTDTGQMAFVNCINLTKVDRPETLKTLGNAAFSGCTALTSLDIPPSVNDMDIMVFHNCSSLTDISIPDGVTALKYNTFEGCTSLKSISIPASVKSIQNAAFLNCSNLKRVNYSGSLKEWNAITIETRNDCLYKADIYCGKKVANTFKKATLSKTIKYRKVKSKKQSFKIAARFQYKTKTTYKAKKYIGKAKKYLSVSGKGAVTVKKGTPKGTYKVKVKISQAASYNVNAKSVTKTVKVKVK